MCVSGSEYIKNWDGYCFVDGQEEEQNHQIGTWSGKGHTLAQAEKTCDTLAECVGFHFESREGLNTFRKTRILEKKKKNYKNKMAQFQQLVS